MNATRFVPFVLALALAAVPVPPALAAESGLDRRIDLELEGAEAQRVLASFGSILGLEATIDPGVTGTVTIELHGVRAETALTAVCESVGCRWRIETGRLEISRDPGAPASREPAPGRADGPAAAELDTLIDMELEGADLRQVLGAFGSIAGVGVEIDDALVGKVSVHLQDTPVRHALDTLCAREDCVWELVETEAGPVLRFAPR